jgi:hypothetical protein
MVVRWVVTEAIRINLILPGTADREFTMKRRDIIIDELHRVRENVGNAHDFDVRRIAATIRQHEDENLQGMIRELPRRTRRQKKVS